MGVYIKNMEMPVIELEWTIRRGADGKWYAIDTNAETSDGEWHEIVFVPPHGRLIDAEKLIQFAKDKARQIADEEAYPPRSIAVSGLSIEDVVNAPTIIEAEEGE